MKKDLKYFMREQKEEIVTAPGPESFKDDSGNVIQFEIRLLDQDRIMKINDMYRKRTMAVDKRGNPIVSGGVVAWKEEKDAGKATRHIIAEALVYPNLKDEDLMKFYNCYDITEMPNKVFSKPGEFEHVIRIVFGALGIGDFGDLDENTEDDIDIAKN